MSQKLKEEPLPQSLDIHLETFRSHSQFKRFVRASVPAKSLQLDTAFAKIKLSSGADCQGYFHEMKEILIKCSYLCQPDSE